MKLSIFEFAKRLLDTNDLDPVYVVLWEAMASGVLDRGRLLDWLLAYWCFYHVGTTCWVVTRGTSEGSYWEAMLTAAGSKEYPRAHERRHFRGRAALDSVSFIREVGRPRLWARLTGMVDVVPLGIVMEVVQSWKGFGPWIAFKAADMLERLGVVRVDFSNSLDRLFDSPRKGAELLWRLEGRGENTPGRTDLVEWAVDRVLAGLGARRAPPGYDRPVNLQEAETVLCKFTSYYSGHYSLGEDITATRRGLVWAGRCRLAQDMLAAGRQGGLW